MKSEIFKVQKIMGHQIILKESRIISESLRL